MKRAVIASLLAAMLFLSSCENKNSEKTESQKEITTTKATSLTIASQTATETTTAETEATTATKAAETTAEVFTVEANDGLSDKDTVVRFCDTVADKWAEMSNTGKDAGLAVYCKYPDCDRFLQLSAKLFDNHIFHPQETDLDIQDYKIGSSCVTIKGVYSSKTGSYGLFVFVVENIGGKLALNDMIFDCENSADNRYRSEFVKDPKPDYWADASRYPAILEKTQEG